MTERKDGINMVVKGANIDIGHALHDATISKLTNMCEIYSLYPSSITVTYSKDKLEQFEVHVLMHVMHADIPSHATDSDAYQALDRALHIMHDNVAKYKDKHNHH